MILKLCLKICVILSSNAGRFCIFIGKTIYTKNYLPRYWTYLSIVTLMRFDTFIDGKVLIFYVIISIPMLDYDGETDGGIDLCQGDTGGPLICLGEGNPYLVGIASWGNACGDVNAAGVYSKVSYFYDWMYSVMN